MLIKKNLIVVIIFIVILLAAIVGGYFLFLKEAPGPLTIVRVQPVWVPNAQFAGIYVAKEKGLYQKAGIEVVFNEYNPEKAVADIVWEGEAEFGIDGADQVLIAQGEGKDIVALAVIYNTNPVAFAVPAEFNITKLEDLKGKRFGFLPDNTSVIFEAMLKQGGMTMEDIILTPYEYDLEDFYQEGKYDIIPIYRNDEVKKFEEVGFSYTLLLPERYGIHFYGDTIFARRDFIEKNPGIVKKFIQATIAGWRDALLNQEEAVEIVHKYDDPDYKVREDFILAESEKLILPARGAKIGDSSLIEWKRMYEVLKARKFLGKDFDITRAYTKEFLR